MPTRDCREEENCYNDSPLELGNCFIATRLLSVVTSNPIAETVTLTYSIEPGETASCFASTFYTRLPDCLMPSDISVTGSCVTGVVYNNPSSCLVDQFHDVIDIGVTPHPCNNGIQITAPANLVRVTNNPASAGLEADSGEQFCTRCNDVLAFDCLGSHQQEGCTSPCPQGLVCCYGQCSTLPCIDPNVQNNMSSINHIILITPFEEDPTTVPPITDEPTTTWTPEPPTTTPGTTTTTQGETEAPPATNATAAPTPPVSTDSPGGDQNTTGGGGHIIDEPTNPPGPPPVTGTPMTDGPAGDDGLSPLEAAWFYPLTLFGTLLIMLLIDVIYTRPRYYTLPPYRLAIDRSLRRALRGELRRYRRTDA